MAKKSSLKYHEAIGRRKSSIASVRLYIASSGREAAVDDLKIAPGKIYVNQKPIAEYFGGPVMGAFYDLPFKLTDSRDRFPVSIHVDGGGKVGQAAAVVLGVSRALIKADPNFRPLLKKQGLLTRDARVRERRKVGTGGRARRQKQSPKR